MLLIGGCPGCLQYGIGKGLALNSFLSSLHFPTSWLFLINICASYCVLGTLVLIWHQMSFPPSVACLGNTWFTFFFFKHFSQGGAVQDISVERSWKKHILPQAQEIHSFIWNHSLWKRPKNLLNSCSTAKDKSTTWSQVGEAETRSHQIPQSQQGDPQLDGIKYKHGNYPWGASGLCPHQAPQFLWPAPDRSPQNTWLWKPMGFMPMRTIPELLKADAIKPRASVW